MSDFKVGDRVVVAIREGERRGYVKAVGYSMANVVCGALDSEFVSYVYCPIDRLEHDSQAHKAVEELEFLPAIGPMPPAPATEYLERSAHWWMDSVDRATEAKIDAEPPKGMPDSLESHSVESVPDPTGHPYNINDDIPAHDWKYYYPDWLGTDVDDGPEVSILRCLRYDHISEVQAIALLEWTNRLRKEDQGG